MSDSEALAMQAATAAVRQVIAQSKNPNTILGRMSPTSVALHAALAAIQAHRDMYDAILADSYRAMNNEDYVPDDEILDRLWGNDRQ